MNVFAVMKSPFPCFLRRDKKRMKNCLGQGHKQQLNSVTYIINSSFNSSFNSRFLHVGIGFRNEVKDVVLD